MENNKTIEEIALRTLGIKTFEQGKRDSLDFHDLFIDCIKQALEECYAAGYKSGYKGGYDDGCVDSRSE